jgi:hypothetical protein
MTGWTPENSHTGRAPYMNGRSMVSHGPTQGFRQGPDMRLQRDMHSYALPTPHTRTGGNEPTIIPNDNSVIAHTLYISPRTRTDDVTEGQLTFIQRDQKVKSRNGELRVMGLSRLIYYLKYGEGRILYDDDSRFATAEKVIRDWTFSGVLGRFDASLSNNASRNNRMYCQSKLSGVMETPNVWIVNDNSANSTKRRRNGAVRIRKDDMAIEGQTLYLLVKRVRDENKFRNMDGMEQKVSEYHWTIEPWSSHVHTHRPPDIMFNNYNDDSKASYRGAFWKIGYLMERHIKPGAGHCSGIVDKAKKAIYPTTENNEYLKAFNGLPNVRIAVKYS